MFCYGTLLLWIHVVAAVTTPAPPEKIHIEKWLLTWNPATEERDVTYTVQYSSFDTDVWKDVPACVNTSFTFCNVTFSKAENEHGCVMLRVQTERRGLTSRPVQACSRHGDSCTPEVSLTARPGSLTVYLSQDHSLFQDYGGHIQHRVYYGMEGESLQEKYVDGVASVSIKSLKEGQRYCTKVQYMYFTKLIGPESCTQCEVIPRSRDKSVQTEVIVVVMVAVIMFVIAVMAYVLICHRGRIKQLLRPPCEIPDFLLEPYPENQIFSSPSSPSEERYDVISFITTKEVRGE
ncbi:interferon alpha/beta receptor 1-like isoform X1 [Seriola lalandi dorsalis]|uniref:Interferon alpha/beta receptor 1-like n=1 Tax=Seriola lalandi dorsalis TaxID=1841481 RepID=A0A3B4WFY2_SERLL|nr:interferon alpha/beta receptor 1-like isoform X1 [Seriola lalandi dorsalis]XP_056244896.1 interferon gamma receptor 2 [Seriola aureovittata]